LKNNYKIFWSKLFILETQPFVDAYKTISKQSVKVQVLRKTQLK